MFASSWAASGVSASAVTRSSCESVTPSTVERVTRRRGHARPVADTPLDLVREVLRLKELLNVVSSADEICVCSKSEDTGRLGVTSM